MGHTSNVWCSSSTCEVLYLLLLFFLMKIICFNKSIYKGDNPVKKRKGDSPLKSSGSDCTCANTDYFIARLCNKMFFGLYFCQ